MVNPMTADTTPDIAPRIVDGEPVCDEHCPRFLDSDDCGTDCDYCRLDDECDHHAVTDEGGYCIPGLRRQRDALQAEIDRLQRKGK